MDVVITVIAVILVIMLWIMLYDSNRFVVRHYPLRDQRIKKSVKAVRSMAVALASLLRRLSVSW